MRVSPNFGSAPSTTRATSRRRAHRLPLAHDHLSQFRGSEHLSIGLDDDALAGSVDESGAAHTGGGLRSIEDIGQRKVKGRKGFREDLHLELFDLAAEDIGVGHAGHREQARLERPVGRCD